MSQRQSGWFMGVLGLPLVIFLLTDHVVKVMQASEKHQLLKVTGAPGSEHESVVHVIKVINRAVVRKSMLRGHINWLYSGTAVNSRSPLICDFLEGPNLHCLVFHKSSATLASVLDSPRLMPLPDHHVDQLFLQLLAAVRALHADRIVHTDICPENIELIDAFVTTQRGYDSESGKTTQKAVLSSVNLRLSFYGVIGLRGVSRGTDQYRAPEVVFRCVLGEIVLGTPIFPHCEPGPLYEHEKALLFHAISGHFSDLDAVDIELQFPRTFEDETVAPIYYNGISVHIKQALKTAVPVRYLFDDMELAEVVEGLVHTDHHSRANVDRILSSRFFYPPPA